MIALWLISVVVFWGYAITYILFKGIPKSWSDTFYQYKKKDDGYIFTLVLWIFAGFLMPIAVPTHNAMMLPLVAIMFVGAAPAFKGTRLEERVHVGGAITSVLSFLLVMMFSYELYAIGAAALSFIILTETKVIKIPNKTMWVESLVIALGHIVVLFENVLT